MNYWKLINAYLVRKICVIFAVVSMLLNCLVKFVVMLEGRKDDILTVSDQKIKIGNKLSNLDKFTLGFLAEIDLSLVKCPCGVSLKVH